METPASPAALQKSSSISSLFGDRLRKGDIKRAESMKVDLKKPKRTPSFTTRRRTQSFRKLQKLEQLDQLPPVEIQGILDRKHELQSGGKKAPVRSWKTLYTVLCGQLLCFFKDQDDFVASRAATPPIIIFKAKCEKADDYTKRKYVFRLCCTDGSEFLFLTSNESEMEDWINKISFHAQLPPNLQLLSYDETHKKSPGVDRLPPLAGGDLSSSSSRGSTPELSRRHSSSRLQGHNYHRSSSADSDRPMVPPPAIPVKIGDSTNDNGIPPPHIRTRQDMADLTRPKSYQGPMSNAAPHHNREMHAQSSIDLPTHHELPPPLPVSAPPTNRTVPHREPWPTDVNSYRHGTVYGNIVQPQRQMSATNTGIQNTNAVYGNNRTATLPLYVSPPPAGTQNNNANDQRRQSESSSESEQPTGVGRKDKRSNVLSSLFRKKRATNL